MKYILLLSMFCSLVNTFASTCVCTTVSCPIVGENTLIEGIAGKGVYYYKNHNIQPVVSHAYATITNHDLDHGSGTTSCTQEYSRMLDDENLECDAGHILAHRLGGPGNQPINIFPQKPSVNRGIFSSFEQKIYNCVTNGTVTANLYWEFFYKNSSNTRPYEVYYNASFIGSECEPIEELFDNKGT
jgi:hypothetical protein